jgi:hypothetical protein
MFAITLLTACPNESEPQSEQQWQIVHEALPGALLSVWGTSSSDVWTVGGDALDGTGPLVLHFDGQSWTRMETGLTEGNLWWVFGFEGGPVYFGGDGGVIVRYAEGTFTTMQTPSTQTVFGIWGSSPDDVWAVGGDSESVGGFAWRLSGGADAWEPEPTVPADVPASAAIWKIYGTGPDDAWLVGSNGVALHWDGAALTPGDTGVGSSLFTVHEAGGRYVAVGGAATGIIVEYDGATWTDVTPDPPPQGLSGVCVADDGDGLAVGLFGGIYRRVDGVWTTPADLDLPVRDDFHGAWIDDEGGLWAVGGQTFSYPLTDGVMLHWGEDVPTGDL